MGEGVNLFQLVARRAEAKQASDARAAAEGAAAAAAAADPEEKKETEDQETPGNPEHEDLKKGWYRPVGPRWSSTVWDHFKIQSEADAEAKCNHCNAKITKNGTGAMRSPIQDD